MLTITENDKTYNFKASAVTKILYKRLFGVEADKFFMDRAELLSDDLVKGDLEKLKKAKELPEADPGKLKLLYEISKNQEIITLNSEFLNFAKQYGYVTYVEANYSPDKVFTELSIEKYYMWLMEFDESFFRDHAEDFQSLYDKNKKSTSGLKNE